MDQVRHPSRIPSKQCRGDLTVLLFRGALLDAVLQDDQAIAVRPVPELIEGPDQDEIAAAGIDRVMERAVVLQQGTGIALYTLAGEPLDLAQGIVRRFPGRQRGCERVELQAHGVQLVEVSPCE